MALTFWQTLVLAILVLFLGRGLNRIVPVFREFNIPEPVSGGFLASLVFGLIYFVFDVQVSFYMAERDNFLLVFFTTIGLSSRFSTLKEGGSSLMVLLVIACTFLVIQNGVGVSLAYLCGINPVLGIIGGSITMSGGHGTAIAWAPVITDKYGLANAAEAGAACATFGLILGGLVGGPVARSLIARDKLKPLSSEHITVGARNGEEREQIDAPAVLTSLLMLAIAIAAGVELAAWVADIGFFLPTYATCLFIGVVLANGMPLIFKHMTKPADCKSLALISDLSLGLFLAISLMSMQLWTLVDLALPILVLLFAQVVVLVVFCYFLIYPLLGRDYDSAVMCSGYLGMALGATPNAIANMTAVTRHCGPSSKAFIVVPLVGVFFIDIANAVVIQLFLGWVG
ncbi:sodium/glutamate symporter [Sansalvadorimonas sp. 2012CJ34-2]|uniref:Sodium/glutamate symporter n=1 Tax=Parendozoicomonas callyspongiae TaxID=2942213 RepID=A0ABT0PFS8_9GAMM|nr:sodium/glutamate symporter [Sansalvadorimonas sp. 2012CJ34-2]MCL6270230.1 sodium/glutamate symporter [Sansalvadorimonas sp. 2012CJ34-2]